MPLDISMFGSSLDMWIFLYFWNPWICVSSCGPFNGDIYGSVDLFSGLSLDLLWISLGLLWISLGLLFVGSSLEKNILRFFLLIFGSTKQQRPRLRIDREDPAEMLLPLLWLRRSVGRGRRKLCFRGGKEDRILSSYVYHITPGI